MDLKQPDRQPMPTGMVLLSCTSLAMTVLMTIFATLYWMQSGAVDVIASELKSAQASSRKAWQKVYDLQEADREGDNAEINRLNLKVWEVQQQLEKCRP